MKLWTNEEIEEIEQKSVGIKQWANSNKNYPSVKIAPEQLLGFGTLFEQMVEEIKFYKSHFEEMQKTVEWYADEKNYELNMSDEISVMEDAGHSARQALRGVTHEPT